MRIDEEFYLFSKFRNLTWYYFLDWAIYWLAFLFVPVSLYMSDSNQTNILSIFMLIT